VVGELPFLRFILTHTGQLNTEKCKYTSMLQVGFGPMTPLFEWSKKKRAFDRAATGIETVIVIFDMFVIMARDNYEQLEETDLYRLYFK
jgi:hypothetical protein